MRETIEHLTGAVYQERYAIDRVLPNTGMGTLFKATQLAVQRPVALRIVNPLKDATAAEVDRFTAEARQIASLHHANIVGLIDFGQDEQGRLFLVREYLEGERLAAVMERDAPLAPERIVAIAMQVLDALAEAHKRGILHRDLNPLNIFVDRLGYQRDFIKLLEFRIRSTSDEGHGLFADEPPTYRAPEDIRGEAVTGQADIYSLGAVLYEMLTGHPPFRGDTVEAVVRAILDDEPPAPTVEGQRVAGPLVDVILACLRKDPEARPAGPFGVVAMLDAREGEPLVVRQGPPQTLRGLAPVPLEPPPAPAPAPYAAAAPLAARDDDLLSGPPSESSRAVAWDPDPEPEPEPPAPKRGTLPYGTGAVAALTPGPATGPQLSHEQVTIRHGGREPVRLAADCDLPGARNGGAFEIPAPPRRNPWPLIVGVGGLAALVVVGAVMLRPGAADAGPAAPTPPGAAAAGAVAHDSAGPAPVAARDVSAVPGDAGAGPAASAAAGGEADAASAATADAITDLGRAAAGTDAVAAGRGDAAEPATDAGPASELGPDATADAGARGPAEVRIESTPKGARVERAADGLLLGTAPATIKWSGDAPLKVRVVAEGFAPQELELTRDMAGTTELVLLEASEDDAKADKGKTTKKKRKKRRRAKTKRQPSSVRDILNN